jgi:hypothetical protein
MHLFSCPKDYPCLAVLYFPAIVQVTVANPQLNTHRLVATVCRPMLGCQYLSEPQLGDTRIGTQRHRLQGTLRKGDQVLDWLRLLDVHIYICTACDAILRSIAGV